MALQFRRGLEADRTTITPSQGEPIYTTDSKRMFIGDGAIAGGLPVGSRIKSTASISSNALTLDLKTARVFTVSLNANITTLTISNPDAASGVVNDFAVVFTADGTARTITWPASVKWSGGSAPTMTSTSGKVDIMEFMSPDNGTTWYGRVYAQNL